MPIKTLLFLLLFAGCALGALLLPEWGALGYVAHYLIGPERQWWHAPLAGLGVRYSYTLALATGIGIVLHWKKLRIGKTILTGQEMLLLLFLGLIWLTVLLGERTQAKYLIVDHPSIKMTKTLVFVLMLTHVATTMRTVHRLFWVLTLGALVLGLQAYSTPLSAFTAGRLETVGGTDFSTSNHLGGVLAALLFIIGVQFLRSRWLGKGVCLLAGAFAANAIILTRSRGALLGIVSGGVVALLLAPKKQRVKIFAGLLIAGAAIIYLTDPSFRHRAGTIMQDSEKRDTSAQSRLEIWQGAWRMFLDHPLGVGAGNFYQNIGRYTPAHPEMDAHSTVLRCAAELGWPGLLLLGSMVLNAVAILRRTMVKAQQLQAARRAGLLWLCYGTLTSLVALLTYGLTGSLVYMESLWWLLALPTCLQRVVENLLADESAARADESAAAPAPAGRKGPPVRRGRPGFAPARDFTP